MFVRAGRAGSSSSLFFASSFSLAWRRKGRERERRREGGREGGGERERERARAERESARERWRESQRAREAIGALKAYQHGKRANEHRSLTRERSAAGLSLGLLDWGSGFERWEAGNGDWRWLWELPKEGLQAADEDGNQHFSSESTSLGRATRRTSQRGAKGSPDADVPLSPSASLGYPFAK